MYSFYGIGTLVLFFLLVNVVTLEIALNLSVSRFTHHCKEKTVFFIRLCFSFSNKELRIVPDAQKEES